MRIPADEVNSTIHNAQRKETYTVWGIPPDHVVERIKKIIEALRAEFGGPEIEPHITVVGLDTLVVIYIVVMRMRFVRPAAHMPHLSLLYGNLTEEERKRALEKVTELDDSIASLKFTMSRLVLYKTHSEARDQHSWEKVMEYNLRPRNQL
ncbi:hypothetical protein ACLB2K_057219 [Fragaria x ananassa]